MTYKKLEHQIKTLTLHDLDIGKVSIKDVRKLIKKEEKRQNFEACGGMLKAIKIIEKERLFYKEEN